MFIDGLSDAVDWQPWLEVNVQIDADRVYPVYALNKIFVFWAQVEIRSSIGPDTQLKLKQEPNGQINSKTDAVNESVLQIYYSYFNLNGEWANPQKIPYEITSNDTITDFSLDFSGHEEAAEKDLDNIQIRCHYTTERQIKPEVDDDGKVNYLAWAAAFKQIETDALNTFYLKASNANGTYYIEQREDGTTLMKPLLPGDTTHLGTRFKLGVKPEIKVNIKLLANPGEDLHIDRTQAPITVVLDTMFLEAVNEGEKKGTLESSDFILRRGLIGDGYAFTTTTDNQIVLYQKAAAPTKTEVVVKADLNTVNTLAEQRKTTFSFIANRASKEDSFQFYPETNLVDESWPLAPTTANATAPIPSLRFGLDTFRSLFPNEDVTQAGRPVLLSLAKDENSLPWICFDYKGGSFLCKPTTGQTERMESFSLATALPEHAGNVSAGFYANGQTYLFFRMSSGDRAASGRYIIMPGLTRSSARPTISDWGQVVNAIQTDGRIDAALVQGDRTFLFRGDQYVVYTHRGQGTYTYVDESYPKRLAQNTDTLPDSDRLAGWGRIDAAFQVNTTSYFIHGDHVVTSDDLTTPHAIAPGTPASEIRAVLDYNGSIYTLDSSGTLSVERSKATLVTKLERLYQRPSNGNTIPLARVTNAFAIDANIYMQVTADNHQVEYLQYRDAGGQVLPFWLASETDKRKAVLVTADAFYSLIDPGSNQDPFIRRWPKTAAISTEPTVIPITGAPSQDVFGFFQDQGQTYIFGQSNEDPEQAATYIKVETIPSGDEAVIRWGDNRPGRGGRSGEGGGRTAHNVDDYLRSEKRVATADVATLLANLSAGFNKDDQVFLISGNQYLRYTLTATNDVSLTRPSAPDRGYPKPLSEGSRDRLPNWERLDAAFQGPDGVVRFFAGEQYSTIPMTRETTEGEASSVRAAWGRVRNHLQETGRVDAAFVLDEQVFLLSGDQYYRYAINHLASASGRPQLDEGYPKSLADNPDRLPNPTPAAFPVDNIPPLFEVDEKLYLFYNSGTRYREYDPQTQAFTNPSDTVSQWLWTREANGAFTNFDAAYSQDGYVFLIKDQQVLKYQNPAYDIIRLSSMTGSELSKALFVGGLEGLLRRSNQELDELPTFTFAETSGDAIIQVKPGKVSPDHFPVNSHLEFQGANGLYYWELFYHAPALIAQALNAAQKFAEAKQWYEYIFDPTEAHRYWKFLPFLAMDIEALIAGLRLWQTSDVTIAPETISAISAAATQVIAKLTPLAVAFMGLQPLSAAEQAELDTLRTLPDRLQDIPETSSWRALGELATALDTLQPATTTDDATQQQIRATQEELEIIRRLPIRYDLMRNNGPEQIKRYLDDPFDPHAIAALRLAAYRRTTVMAYINNLLDWGDMLFRQYTRESINEARMLYVLAYDLLGKKPVSLGTQVLSEAAPYAALRDATEGAYDFLFDAPRAALVNRGLSHAALVHESVGNPYFYIPENEQLLGYWERVEDRLYKIRHCLNIMGIEQPLPLFQPPIDPMAIVQAVAGGGGISAAVAGLSVTVPHYRFTFMLNKARELVSKLNQFGNDLLGTLEKKDAEDLSLLQNRQESVMLQMTKAVKEAQLREAQENLDYLKVSRASAETQLQHYQGLIAAGKLSQEHAQIALMTAASTVFFLIPVLKIAAAIAKALPDVKLGAPTTIGASLGGSTIGAALGFLAESGESIAEGLSMQGEALGMEAQFLRSEQDWTLQRDLAIKEIEQLDHQIAGANWQIRAAEHELAAHEKEAEHNQSIHTFMKEKFSNQQLYQWMSGKLSALYFQTYKLAHDMAKAAERSFQFERGMPENQVQFISGTYWDSLRKGLLAGDSLGHDLDRLEQAYLDTHARGFEITKTISLAELDPMAFLELKSKGVCEFHFTEELFDYDFPGHYRRQVKTIGLVLNAGEGKTVNATLTQLRHKTVMEPDVKAVKYLLQPQDDQPLTIRSDWRPSQQIAVSQIDPYTENSNGLFELRFDDDRYLPFEGTGAVSSWRLELSGKRGSYNRNELAEVKIELKYTARQGGKVFAEAVKGLLKPYETAVYFDLATMFPNEFFAWVYGETEDLEINVTRELFPNLSGSKITGVYSLFEMKDDGEISVVMNDDSALTLRSHKLLLTNALVVGARGETWRFTAKGQKLDLVNMGLVFAYKAAV
jgi:hypothetical protein